MEDDFDIYEDLDFGKKQYEDNSEPHKTNEELSEKVKKLEQRVKSLETELTNETSQRKILETNFSSLLKTAKNELSRKDRIISDLRIQIDNFYFRRNKTRTQNNDSRKNNPNKLEAKKDPEPILKCQAEENQGKADNLDKSLPFYLSPGPQLISRFESTSDDEDTEVTYQPKKLISTVFGERLKKRLKEQEEKERLQMEEAKSLTSVPKNNETADTRTEVVTPSNINMDNKENQYRLISLDVLPKKNFKRASEDKVNEVLDKRKKYFEFSEASQSCKNKEIDHVENSGSCTNKFIYTSTHTSEYFCSIDSGNKPSESVDKRQKKSPEHDEKLHSSRNVAEQRDDRYFKKYKNNDYRDNRSKSRSRVSSDSEKNYSSTDRGRIRSRGRHHDSEGRKSYYNRDDDFNRNRSRSYLDSRYHVKQWKNNEIAYENDINKCRYPNDKIHGEVRRSRRIEARSHSHHVEYNKDNNYHNKDNFKIRKQHEEKNRTRRRSRSRGRSRERNSADSTSSKRNGSGQIDNEKEYQLKFNNTLEEGEIPDNLITDEEMKIINNIFEESDETVRNNVVNPVFQSPREERIENIQEFIQKFDAKEETMKVNDNKNLKKNIDFPTDIKLKDNDNKNSPRHKRYISKEEKPEKVTKVNLDQQIVNIDVKNIIKKVDQEENKTNQEIFTIKKKQLQDSNLELSVNINSKPMNNDVEIQENKCDPDKAKIIQNNEDKNNSDKQPEIITSSTEDKESTITRKPKIMKMDNFTATRDPEYCKILSKYLKKKPELHSSTTTETSTTDNNKRNEENEEEVHSEPIENTEPEKCEKEGPVNVKSDSCIQINTSEKSEESSSSSTSSALKIVCEPKPTANPVDTKIKDDECFISPIPKNPVKRTATKNKITAKKPSISTGSEVKKVTAPRKKKEKANDNQNSSKSKDVMILTTRRRPTRLSDFSSPVTVVSTIQNVDGNQISKANLEAIKE